MLSLSNGFTMTFMHNEVLNIRGDGFFHVSLAPSTWKFYKNHENAIPYFSYVFVSSQQIIFGCIIFLSAGLKPQKILLLRVEQA